jgi:excisionase family DNA binding protein
LTLPDAQGKVWAVEQLLTVADVCRICKVSRSHAVREIMSGRLHALNIGRGPQRRDWRVRPEDLEAYLKSLSGAAATGSAPAGG